MSDEGMSGDMLERYARRQATAAEPTLVRDVYRYLLARLDAAEREPDARLLDALREIARPLDCGCVPCTGQCRSAYAMQIEVEARQDIARAALTANHSAPVVEE